MDSNPRHAQWVLNGLRFHTFSELQPLLTLLLRMAPVRSLIMQVFTSVAPTGTRSVKFASLIEMIVNKQ